jgi:hypothetical protein
VAKSPIPANMLGYKKDLPDYDYNPQKAKALLKHQHVIKRFLLRIKRQIPHVQRLHRV